MKVDEEIKKLLKSMKELGHKLKEYESLKKKERAKLEGEWTLKNQELMNYLGKLESKIRRVIVEGKTEESKKFREEWRTIFKVSYNSHPHIRQRWDPFRIEHIIEEVYKKAQQKKFDKNDVEKENYMTKTSYNIPSFYISKKEWQKDKTKMKWFVRLKELAYINPDPKAVRKLLLHFKDYDEGLIDKESLKKEMEEFKNFEEKSRFKRYSS